MSKLTKFRGAIQLVGIVCSALASALAAYVAGAGPEHTAALGATVNTVLAVAARGV